MATQTTHGIRISVEPFYQSEYSRPVAQKFIFSYKIRIENKSNKVVQLLRRQWHIVDASGSRRQVEGEGVIGEQPILQPDAIHEYMSWCHLSTEMGKMYGTYLMQNKNDDSFFRVRVPEFRLTAPLKLN